MTIRWLVVATTLFFAGPTLPAAGAQQGGAADPRLIRLDFWVETVLTHRPGDSDDRIALIGSWPGRELRTLELDVGSLVQVMAAPSRLVFSVDVGQQKPQTVRYTTPQLRHLREIACALAGVNLPQCQEQKRSIGLDPFLSRIAELATRLGPSGDGNYVARRGALVHSDIFMLGLATAVEPLDLTPGGQQSFRITITDGRSTDLNAGLLHWEIARMLLDEVKPSGSPRPAPERDDMVRLWYRATAAWMQREDHLDTKHLEHGLKIFPDDPELNFLTGALHETYASPPIQAALHSAVLPTGVRIEIDSERSEQREAEKYLRRAVASDPRHAEAHLRLGRILDLTGHPAEAAEHLREALALVRSTSADGALLTYYGSMFLGIVEEGLGHHDTAKELYERAASLYPLAQSPRIALSALARRAGNRDLALDEIGHVFKLPSKDWQQSDPWWFYSATQGRHADALLKSLREPFLGEDQQ